MTDSSHFTDNGLEQRVFFQRQQENKLAFQRTQASLSQALPPDLRHVTWKMIEEDPEIPPAILEAVSEYVHHPTRNLVLLGDLGVGKTWTATAVLKQVIKPNEKFLFQPVSELFEQWKDRDWSYSKLTDPYWLFLDDLGGAHQLTEREMDRFYAIFNRRDQYHLSTIVTSNMDPDMLLHWIGARCWERLRRGTVIQWAGVSRR